MNNSLSEHDPQHFDLAVVGSGILGLAHAYAAVKRGLKVAVFRQSRSGQDWIDSAVSSNTLTDLENAILTRARQLRMAAIPQ